MSIKKRQNELDRISKFPILETDDHPWKTGVLLSDEIEFYAQKDRRLICPFKHEHLKPAAYELTVGDEAMVSGKLRSLGDSPEDDVLPIPPFDVAVIKTEETLNLPRFLIGRWNIRTRWAYKGLVWVGGPQVDPGYVGHLFCPIYNLSNKEVLIRKGDAIAVIDFIKTSTFDRNRGKEEWERYPRPPSRPIIEDFEIDDFRSGPFEQAREIPKIKESLADGLREVRGKIDLFTSLVFVVLTILMTAVVLPHFGVKNTRLDTRILDGLTLSLALLALLLAFSGWKFPRNVKPSAALTIVGVLTDGASCRRPGRHSILPSLTPRKAGGDRDDRGLYHCRVL